MKLIMCKGLPASGKTTWAKKLVDKGNTKRVNKDDLRAMLDNTKWSKSNEAFILSIRDYIVRSALLKGFNVIVDDTNLATKHEPALRSIAEAQGAEFEIKDFTDVPLNECLRRNAQRPNYVSEKTIKTMHRTFIKQKGDVAQYRQWNPDLPTCIIVDIDGTLAHMNGREAFDYNNVQNDLVDTEIRDIVNNSFWDGRDLEPRIPQTYVVIVSGREDSCYSQTIDWLKANNVWYDEIYMRKTGDYRDDRIVKKEIYEEFIKPRYNVRFVLDDRDKVVRMWREEGLKVLQVAEGDF